MKQKTMAENTHYASPEIIIAEISAEKGFAQSGLNTFSIDPFEDGEEF